jgi:hypothetical protein
MLATLALASACATDGSPSSEPSVDTTLVLPSGSPSTSGPTTPPVVVTTPSGPVFTVDGTGPYQLGSTLDALESAGALAEVATGGEVCSLNTRARGTGAFSDVRLSFRPDGLLYLITNRSPDIPTPSGARIGTTLAQLNTMYAGATHEELAPSAFLVSAGSAGRGILFDLDASDRVFTMSAGDADYLESSYVNGTDFC